MTNLKTAIQEAEEELKRGDIVSFDNAKDAINHLAEMAKKAERDYKAGRTEELTSLKDLME